MARRRRHSYGKVTGTAHRCSFCGAEKQTTKGANVFRKHSLADWQPLELPCDDPNQSDMFGASVADREEDNSGDFYQLAPATEARIPSKEILADPRTPVPGVGVRTNALARVVAEIARPTVDGRAHVFHRPTLDGQKNREESLEDIVGLALRAFPGSSVVERDSSKIAKFDGHVQLEFAEHFQWTFFTNYDGRESPRFVFEAPADGGYSMGLRLLRSAKKWPETIAALYKGNSLHAAWEWDGSQWVNVDIAKAAS